MKLNSIICVTLVPMFIAMGCTDTRSGYVPGETEADMKLQKDTMRGIMHMESFVEPSCKERRIVDTQIVKKLSHAERSSVERWTVDRCGKPASYLVTFNISPSGGTDLKIDRE